MITLQEHANQRIKYHVVSGGCQAFVSAFSDLSDL